jgi:hypothetical protein
MDGSEPRPIPWRISAETRIPAALHSIRPDEADLAVVSLIATWHEEMDGLSMLIASLPEQVSGPVLARMISSAFTALGLIRGVYPGDVLAELVQHLDTEEHREAFAEMFHGFDLSVMADEVENDPFGDLPVIECEPEIAHY